MERIKAAIEKAKQGQNKEKRSTHSAVLAKRKSIEVPPAPGSSELNNLTYKETRTVVLDVDHLEKNRIVSPGNINLSFFNPHILYSIYKKQISYTNRFYYHYFRKLWNVDQLFIFKNKIFS